jgi:DnaJ-domain-containing protein 1
VELRHGTLALVRATFAGFLALPAPSAREWWDVLGVHHGSHVEAIKAAYRRLAGEHHPDRGGDPTRMAEINEAYRKAIS